MKILPLLLFLTFSLFSQTPQIRGFLQADWISPSELCLTGDYCDFLRNEFHRTYGFRLKALEKKRTLRPYIREMEYRAAAAKTVAAFRPAIYNEWQKSETFSLTDAKNRTVSLHRIQYRLDFNGLLFTDLPVNIRQYAVLHRVHLNLDAPLSTGIYTLRGPFGQILHIPWDPKKMISFAYRIDPFGYAPEHPKIIYASSRRISRTFELVNADTGTVELRGKVQSVSSPQNLTGEKTMLMDISAIRKPGRYYLRAKELGRSAGFEIKKQVPEQIYQILCKKISAFHCGGCHPFVCQDDFPWETADYAKKAKQADRGFFKPDGERVSLDPAKFLSSRELVTRNVIPGLSGGWHDSSAGKSPEQFSAVNDLLSAALWYPGHFNASNDPAREAIYGLNFWYKAQQADGGCGITVCKPAAESSMLHLSAPSIRGTMLYASHASMMALVLKKQGKIQEFEKYLKSALRAWDYALDSAHRLQKTYRTSFKNKVILLRYYESPELPAAYLFKCAFNLLLLTGDKKYAAVIQSHKPLIRIALNEYFKNDSPLLFAEFQQYGPQYPDFADLYAFYRKQLLSAAEKIIQQTEAGSYNALSGFTPVSDARILIAAWRMTNDKVYRDAAVNIMHYSCGANITGMPLWYYETKYPYTEAAERIYGLYLKPDPKNNFPGCACSFIKQGADKKENKMLLKKHYPQQYLALYFCDGKNQDESPVCRYAAWAFIIGALMPEQKGEVHGQ